MRNLELRDLLFNSIWCEDTCYWSILNQYYNTDSNLPIKVVLKAHQELLQAIMQLEWIKWNDVIHNASD